MPTSLELLLQPSPGLVLQRKEQRQIPVEFVTRRTAEVGRCVGSSVLVTGQLIEAMHEMPMQLNYCDWGWYPEDDETIVVVEKAEATIVEIEERASDEDGFMVGYPANWSGLYAVRLTVPSLVEEFGPNASWLTHVGMSENLRESYRYHGAEEMLLAEVAAGASSGS